MARPLLAIVGCGGIAPTHAKNLRRGARLLFASRRPESARRLAQRFGGETADSLREVLDRAEVRGVVLCTPAALHAEQAVAALEAGKAVLVEKPLTTDFGVVSRLGAVLADRPPGALMVAENYAYRPSLDRLRRHLPDLGSLRRIVLKKVTKQAATGWRAAHGALLEGGIHLVALLGAILRDGPDGQADAGQPDAAPAAVRAEFPGDARPERHSVTEIEYPSGLRATIRYGWDRASLPGGVFQHSRIEGAAGRILYETNGLYLALRGGRAFRFAAGPLADLMGFGAMARDFLAVVRDPARRPRYGFPEAARDLRIVEQAYRCLASAAPAAPALPPARGL